jgi:hypothetical protein
MNDVNTPLKSCLHAARISPLDQTVRRKDVMAPHLRLWHTDPDGVLTTEEDAFRLTVRPPKREGGAAWFLVLRQLGTEFSIAAGGTEENIRAAMTAASFMAKLLAKEPRSVP